MQRPDGFSDESLTESEKRGLERAGNFMTSGAAYALEHGTRPSTIGHVLSTSPMALLAWYVGILNVLHSPNNHILQNYSGVARSFSTGLTSLFHPRPFLNSFLSIG